MLTSFATVVWRLCELIEPGMLNTATLKLAHHKVEVFKEDSSTDWWFNKSCTSNRVATVILDPSTKKGKRAQWKIYFGGGAVDAEQTELLCGAVVLVKNWKWAALTYLAAWVLTCCCPSGEPASPDPDLFFLEEQSIPMDSGLEEEATPQQEIENNGASFKAMCDQFWTTLCDHETFKEWPMGPPGSSEVPAAARSHNAFFLQQSRPMVALGRPEGA